MRLYQRYTKIKKSNSAGALLFSIITAFVLSSLCITLVMFVINQQGMIIRETNRTIAFYRAQAGMEYAIWRAYTNPSWLLGGPYNVTIGGSNVTITITPGGLSNYTFRITTSY